MWCLDEPALLAVVGTQWLYIGDEANPLYDTLISFHAKFRVMASLYDYYYIRVYFYAPTYGAPCIQLL